MENKVDNQSHISESDQKKLAGLTIGVGVGTVVATGATVGAVVTNSDNVNVDTTDAEVSVDQQEVVEHEVAVDEQSVISEEDLDEFVMEDSVEVLEQDIEAEPEMNDIYIDDICPEDDLPDDSIGDIMMM